MLCQNDKLAVEWKRRIVSIGLNEKNLHLFCIPFVLLGKKFCQVHVRSFYSKVSLVRPLTVSIEMMLAFATQILLPKDSHINISRKRFYDPCHFSFSPATTSQFQQGHHFHWTTFNVWISRSIHLSFNDLLHSINFRCICINFAHLLQLWPRSSLARDAGSHWARTFLRCKLRVRGFTLFYCK